jgi:DNA polymerase-3 subunit delta'
VSGFWDHLWGQGRVKDLLSKATDRPGDSYLFVGPPGVGKATAARHFAAAVLCEKGGCGECGHCTRVLSEVHPDVQTFGPEGFTYPVDSIREMVVSASQSPLVARRRVFIVREADRITERSQNALLKTLEEPNPSLTWILVAVALEAFLPTLLSRSRIVEFAGIESAVLENLVRNRFDLSEQEAGWIVTAARGDLEMAVALASDPKAREIRDLAFEIACEPHPSIGEVLGAAHRLDEIAQQARAEAEDRQREELRALEEVLGGGPQAQSQLKRAATRHRRELRRVETGVQLDFLTWIGTAFRDLAFVSAGGDPGMSTAPDKTERLLRGAPARATRQFFSLVDRAVGGRLSILENASPSLVVESVLLRLAAPANRAEAS